MPAVLSEEKIKIIRQRLIEGQTCQSIADELQLSLRSVLRYKKQFGGVISDDNVKLNDDQAKSDYRQYMSRKEKYNSETMDKELYLFDDPIEGWVHHLTKGDVRLKQSAMWWRAIVYPESAPPTWIEKLVAYGFRIAISPLHDKDTWDHDNPEYVNSEGEVTVPLGSLYKKGDLKKAHWHLILVVDKRVSYKEMNDIVQSVCHCPCIQRCYSLKQSYEYFLHIGKPDKYQDYKKEDIQTFNNFHVEPNNFEKGLLVSEMTYLIDEHHIEKWIDCVQFFRDNPEMNLLLVTKSSFFQSYVKSRYFETHPNDVRYTEFKQVSRFSFENEDVFDDE